MGKGRCKRSSCCDNADGLSILPPACPTPSVSIAASQSSFRCGDAITLTYLTQDVDGTASIDNGIGFVAPNIAGSIVVSPLATTTYTLSAVNSCGTSDTDAVTLTFNAPTALINVFTRFWCNDPIPVNYFSAGMGHGASINIYASVDGGPEVLIGSPAPNSWGHIDYTPVGMFMSAVTFRIVAQDDCWTFEDSQTSTIIEPTASFSANGYFLNCGDNIVLSYSTENWASNGTVTITMETEAGGPDTIATPPINTTGTITVPGNHSWYEFRMYTTDACNNEVLNFEVTVAGSEPEIVASTIDAGCDVTLQWEAISCGGGDTLSVTIEGPGFTGQEAVDDDGTRLIISADHAGEAVLDTCYKFSWTIRATTPFGTTTQVLSWWVPPRITVFTASLVPPFIDCDSFPHEWQLTWDSLFAVNGIAIYDSFCQLIYASANPSGTVNVIIEQATCMTCYAIECVKASCNNITRCLEDSDCDCACSVNVQNDYHLVENVSAYLYSCIGMRDCTTGGGKPEWDHVLHTAGACTWYGDYDEQISNDDLVAEGDGFQPGIIELKHIQTVTECYWKLSFTCIDITENSYIEYRKLSGNNPTGEYAVYYQECGSWPATLHITHAWSPPTQPPSNPCST